MAHAPLSTRDRLLKAGWAVAHRQGVKALTVRAVAAKAGVNLGSFVHHFGTRDAFLSELIERWYAPMFSQLKLAAAGPAPAVAALRSAVLQLLRWLLDHRGFVAQLLLDASAGEAAAQRFLSTVDQRHPALLLALVQRAQDEGALRRDEALHQLMFIMTTIAVPVLAFHLATRAAQSQSQPPLLLQLARYADDPAQAALRLDWALKGLAP